ncbi:DAK2 domain-containing protein [Clostridium sp. BJN0001]|uniref:DAK2 domain-containing protein n=1 Tax=Clostridium sp. BJN0001 TaxID=2930219 RepID=UPI001FD15746|nr:DAK2 domain-containing protein [Clostridium sp. BJN0001]
MEYKEINGHDFYNMVVNASNRLAEQSDFVNSLNVFPVPDGDTGTNMSMTFSAAVKEIENLNTDSISEVSKKLAKGALMGARGNSGVILSQILRGLSKGFEGALSADASKVALSLKEGAKSAYKAVMRPTEGTILSVIRKAADGAESSENDDIVLMLDDVIREAKIMLDKTPELLPALKKAKVVDSGGMGLYIILEGMRNALRDGITAKVDKKTSISQGKVLMPSEEEIKFGYCTEFIIKGDAKKADSFKEQIKSLGDCMIVVGYEDVIKVHIHTNDPGKVLSYAVEIGELSKIKIDNMREEHREMFDDIGKMQSAQDNVAVSDEEKKYAFITVAMGDGIANTFKQLGCDFVIEGGQTMNPSTQDILEAAEKLNAEHIFILPNNKNIIMAADQAAEISKKNIHVIKTKTIPQGIACFIKFNPEEDIQKNIDEMNEAISSVKTASLTFAVRDTEMDGFEIKEGNILGLIEGKISEVGNNKTQILEKLIDSMIDEDSELITVYYGKDVSDDEAQKIEEEIQEKYDELDVQVLKGNQPLYYYLISIE